MDNRNFLIKIIFSKQVKMILQHVSLVIIMNFYEFLCKIMCCDGYVEVLCYRQ